MNEQQLQRLRDGLRWLINRHGITVVHHGDCVGADAQFHRLCVALTLIPKIVIHPPIDPRKRAYCDLLQNYSWPSQISPESMIIEVRHPKEYLVRNKDIVRESDFLFVGPSSNTEELRSGTWSTYRFAKTNGKPYDILAR